MHNVQSLTIDEILDKASEGYFQIPQFQREFVWNNNQISTLIESALQGLPCGSIVTWEYSKNNIRKGAYRNVRLEETNSGIKSYINFPPDRTKHPAPYLVIDGLQRITAISVAFGGLRNTTGKHRLGGRFFIDLDAPEIVGSISYKNKKQIREGKFDKEDTWVNTGLFPLNNLECPLKKSLSGSALKYWISIVMPLCSDSDKRLAKLQVIQAAITSPIMAEMPMEKRHPLADIAASFELLNTQGTPVSMVDILHSNLFEWFESTQQKNFDLRDWIDSICQDTNKSHGWGREKKRQIILQFGVAIELMSSGKKVPSRSGSKVPENITNKDILNLNEMHWYDLVQNDSLFKDCILHFQKCILGRQFPEKDCPYPISASIYIALYWKFKKESPNWTLERLNQIFKAFFWMNCLSERYETDSLGVPRDMEAIEKLLMNNVSKDDDEWKKNVDAWLVQMADGNLPTALDIQEKLLGKANGAMRQALQLPIKFLPELDIINTKSDITYPKNDSIQMHHIFPRNWINNNATLTNFGPEHNNKEYILEVRECLANKTPLIDTSNNSWKAKSPQTIIDKFTNKAQFKGKKIWVQRFITNSTYDALSSDEPMNFLKCRAKEIQEWLSGQCEINL